VHRDETAGFLRKQRGIPVISFRLHAVPAAVAAAFCLCFAACHAPAPVPHGKGVDQHGLTKLIEKNPVDVAVAPIQNQAGKDVPVKDLRECFQKGLVTRRYSPLALAYVDRNTTEAGYKAGASKEQAVLEIKVESFDTSVWKTRNAITARIQVRMLDAANGEELWSGRIDQRYEFGTSLDALPTETMRMHKACDTITNELLAALPARNPQGPGAP
jgi:TolB-like protein